MPECNHLDTIRAPPEDIITVEVPEWRIVDDTTWFAAQDVIHARAEKTIWTAGPRTTYALSALARCSHCQGSIGTQNSRQSDGSHIRPRSARDTRSCDRATGPGRHPQTGNRRLDGGTERAQS